MRSTRRFADRFQGRGALWVSAIAVLALAVWFFAPVRQIVDPTLDTSNYAAFSYFTAKEIQYGQDVLFPGGPYAFVHYGFVYGGNLFWKRFPLELLIKLTLGVLAVWFFRRAGGGLMRWLWMAVLLLAIPMVEDLPYDFVVLLGSLCLLDNHLKTGGRSAAIAAALAALLGLFTLMKGTHAVLALAIFGLLFLQAVVARNFRRLRWLAGTYLASITVLSLLAGQNPLHLPRHLRGIIEQSSGFNTAMAIQESGPAFLTGCGALLSLWFLIALCFGRSWRSAQALPAALLLAGFSFVEWKHGFVRADGHVFIFYQYACLAALTILLHAATGEPAIPTRILRAGRIGFTSLAFGLGVWGDGAASFARHRLALEELPSNLATAWRQVSSPIQTKAQLDAALAEQRRKYDLPLTRSIVGNAPVDFFGTEHGYIALNRFHYAPRPVPGGNFSVFNAWLLDANLRHVDSPQTGPEYFLARVEPFDDRFLGQEDGGTLRALAAHYMPIEAEQGMVVLRRREYSETMPEARLLETKAVRLDEPIRLPDVKPGEMLAIEMNLPLNLAGRLRSFLYKSPLMFMDLEGDGIVHPRLRRVVPSLFSRPVVMNPVIEDTRDLLGLWLGDKGKTAASVCLRTDHPGLYATGRFELRAYALPRPQAAEAGLLREKIAFPAANVPPLSMTPPNAPLRRFDGLLVQMLDPPGRIDFALSGENELQFQYGIDAEAYLRGETDGVEFLVDLERPRLPAHTIFRRWLQPRAEPKDRGSHIEQLFLPPYPEGTRLVLRTDYGADQNGAWDWGYFTGIQLLGNGYVADQFPHFNRIPASTDVTMAGRLAVGDREVFMLNPPGSLSFTLGGDERRLLFSAGLLEGAYTKGGESDGVEILVELRAPGGTITRLLEARLNPRDNPADRGDRKFDVAIPTTSRDGELVLTISPGPAGNGAWDWSYIAGLQIE